VPVTLVNESEIRIARASKFAKSPEWNDALKVIHKGIPSGQGLKISLSDSTLKLFKHDKTKALAAFRQKLRSEVGDRYKVHIVGDEIAVLNRKQKH
jgi:hypothetical protein